MKRKRPVTKAIIAAAGYGTRFLPATKNQPKEMLPIIDKPIIHYLVDECVKSGITDIILVTRAGQHIMEDYFDSHAELENLLERDGKTSQLRIVQEIPEMANFVYVRQPRSLPYGNGTPLLCAAPLIDNDEPFAYLFGDDMVLSKTPCLKQMIDAYLNNDCDGVIVGQEVPLEEVQRYGIVDYDQETGEFIGLVEKPLPEETPSQLASFGRYILEYPVVEKILQKNTGKDGELWLVDAITSAARDGSRFLIHELEGKWMTTGDPFRYMTTMVEFALEREDFGQQFREYLKSLKI